MPYRLPDHRSPVQERLQELERHAREEALERERRAQQQAELRRAQDAILNRTRERPKLSFTLQPARTAADLL